VFLTLSVLPAKLTPGVSDQDQIHRFSDSPWAEGQQLVVVAGRRHVAPERLFESSVSPGAQALTAGKLNFAEAQ
jgi:hypothetical protein